MVGVGAVGPAGDVDATVMVDGDPPRRIAAVGAIAVEPRLRRVPVDVAAADLPAGGLADVKGAAPLVQADPLVLRCTPFGARECDGGLLVVAVVGVMRVRGRRDCDGCDHS